MTLAAVLAGYTTLAAVTSGQIFWLSLIAAAAYLLMRFADDLTTAIFSPRGWASARCTWCSTSAAPPSARRGC